MFGAQIVAEVESIDMLANSVLIPGRDHAGSLNTYDDGLSIHMHSIISGLGLMDVEEIMIGDAVHINIPQSSIGE